VHAARLKGVERGGGGWLRVLGGAVLALSCSGCFPAVTHGPRVESGLSAGAMVGATAGTPTYTEGDAGGLRLRNAVQGVYLGYGLASSTPGRVGVYAAASVPVRQVDAYLQLPPDWTGPLVGGLGVVAAPEGVLPYAQLGSVSPEADGWWVALAQGRHRPSADYLCSSRAWMATAALQRSRGGLRSHFYVQGATGHLPAFRSSGTSACERGEAGHALAIGISLGWQQRRSAPDS
jgi:hypothetical protein